jgi:hypothetical protein
MLKSGQCQAESQRLILQTRKNELFGGAVLESLLELQEGYFLLNTVFNPFCHFYLHFQLIG